MLAEQKKAPDGIIVSFKDLPTPKFERPVNPKDPKTVITDIRDYNISISPSSDPYYMDQERQPSCKSRCAFFCCRGPTYVVGCCWGMLSSLAACFAYVFCCRKTYTILEDQEFTHVFTHLWPFTGLVTDEVDQKTQEVKGHVMDASGLQKASGVTFEGYEMQGAVVKWAPNWELLSIQIGTQQPVTPKDGDIWKLAKLRTIYACHYILKYGVHPSFHFDQQTFVELFWKQYPNEAHFYRQLLNPHIQHMDVINHRVLEGDLSVLNAQDGTCCCWDVQITDRANIHGIMREYTQRFPRLMLKSPTPILQPFYQAVHTFVTSVLKTQSDEEWKADTASRKQFYADLVHYMGYPSLDADKREDLANVLTQSIFVTSVLHSAEHNTIAGMDIESLPMALRNYTSTKEPSRCCWGSSKLISIGDAMKSIMFYNLFTRWWRNRAGCCWTDSRLGTTTYPFEDQSSALKAAATQFRVHLIQAEQEVHNSFPHFPLNLDRMSRSIEF